MYKDHQQPKQPNISKTHVLIHPICLATFGNTSTPEPIAAHVIPNTDYRKPPSVIFLKFLPINVVLVTSSSSSISGATSLKGEKGNSPPTAGKSLALANDSPIPELSLYYFNASKSSSVSSHSPFWMTDSM